MNQKKKPHSNTNCVFIGRFGAAHGVKGYISVQSDTERKEDILTYKPWLVATANGQLKEVKYTAILSTNKKIVVKVDGYDDREQVQVLTGKSIAIDKAKLPKLSQDEYYWHELIGLTVKNKADVILGQVVDMMETGSNDVLIVEQETKQHLIPYLPGDFVLEIDLDSQLMLVDWDESQ